MKTVKIERIWRKKNITASVSVLDQGIQAGLYGGDLTHIGAVTVISAQGEMRTDVFPGHNYDGLTGAEIRQVVGLTDEMLEEMAAKLL